VEYIQLLRFIRIFRDQPDVAVVSRPGKHFTLLPSVGGIEKLEEQATVQWTPPGEPPQRFASTMMTMDGI
jgi:translation machinery-associated protein 16